MLISCELRTTSVLDSLPLSTGMGEGVGLLHTSNRA
jgi:hypothetical protein